MNTTGHDTHKSDRAQDPATTWPARQAPRASGGAADNLDRLPHRNGQQYVTDGGLETDLIFHHGLDLPLFAAFPLVRSVEGRAHLKRYFDSYATIAAAAQTGLLLETPTWRASADWATRLGWSASDVAAANVEAVELLAGWGRDYREGNGVQDVLVVGMVGPRGDGYAPETILDPDQAATYHGPQLAALAAAGADLATGYTLTHVGEAIGVVWAARAAGIPVAVSFTVETDGRLPDGTTLAEAIISVDATAPPEYFGINCAHPHHIERGLSEPGPWHDRVVVLRPNASTLSHADLDEADHLDEGDPSILATDVRRIRRLLPRVSVLGGCCGTDDRHVAAVWHHTGLRAG